ncbi:MAG: uroporphyrinogen decarboxylase family protein [Dehalobacterium sp.]
MGKTTEELYNESLKRVNDAIALKAPDRVPIIPVIQAFPMYYSGVTIKDAMYDYREKATLAFDKFFEDFKPDLGWDPIFMFPAKVLDILDLQWFRWPGNGVEDNRMYQFVEGEFMTGDEYEEFASDPTNFILSKYLPRCFTSLKGFENLSSIRQSIWLGWFTSFPRSFAAKETRDSFKAVMEATDILMDWLTYLVEYGQKMKNQWGVPVAYGGFSFAPFDLLGDTMRGTVPIMMDIRRRPEQLLKAIDALIPISIEMGVRGAQATGIPYIWMWLHKGVDEFMSDEQFRTFYWPSLLKVVNALVDEGLVPIIYGEGSMNNRLEVMRELPKGKTVCHFENVDMAKAKDVLGDVACISGNVPNALLCTGTPQDVKDYCKFLIDVCGKDGGFMLDTNALVDEAKPENMKAMFEFTKEYGRYY